MGHSLGFTGSRNEPTVYQKEWMSEELVKAFTTTQGFTSAHHGCCIGSDAHFHDLVKQLLLSGLVRNITLHPPSDRSREMEITQWELANCLWYPRKPYLIRNRDIATYSHRLLATPDVTERHRGSGTWYTIHAAENLGKPVYICMPDGELLTRNVRA